MLPTTKPLPSEPVRIRAGAVELVGDLVVPDAPRAVVVFAPEGAGGRNDPRQRAIANVLDRDGLATLLFDPLARDEASVEIETGRYDGATELATRLSDAIEWTRSREELAGLPVCLFGMSSGASAALEVAADAPGRVAAIAIAGAPTEVSDDEMLEAKTPTLLVVGEQDPGSDRFARDASERGDRDLRVDVLPDTTSPFDDPGLLDDVAHRASEWFAAHV